MRAVLAQPSKRLDGDRVQTDTQPQVGAAVPMMRLCEVNKLLGDETRQPSGSTTSVPLLAWCLMMNTLHLTAYCSTWPTMRHCVAHSRAVYCTSPARCMRRRGSSFADDSAGWPSLRVAYTPVSSPSHDDQGNERDASSKAPRDGAPAVKQNEKMKSSARPSLGLSLTDVVRHDATVSSCG